MLIYLKRSCDYIKYRLLKQKKETKKLQKNTCSWYIETKLVLIIMLCICILLLPKILFVVTFCAFHFIFEIDLLLYFKRCCVYIIPIATQKQKMQRKNFWWWWNCDSGSEYFRP